MYACALKLIQCQLHWTFDTLWSLLLWKNWFLYTFNTVRSRSSQHFIPINDRSVCDHFVFSLHFFRDSNERFFVPIRQRFIGLAGSLIQFQSNSSPFTSAETGLYFVNLKYLLRCNRRMVYGGRSIKRTKIECGNCVMFECVCVCVGRIGRQKKWQC